MVFSKQAKVAQKRANYRIGKWDCFLSGRA